MLLRIGNIFDGGGNPIHIVLLVCLREENSNPVKQLVVVVGLVRIEGNADPNPRVENNYVLWQ